MNKKYFVLLLAFVLLTSFVCAQSSRGYSVTMTVIGSNGHSFGPASPDPNKIRVVEEFRDPTAADITDGIKNKSQVAITVPQSNGTARWAHSLRVRAVNLTTYNGTNEDNKTVYYNDIKVYDPTTGKNYTTQMASIEGDPKLYINWYGWVPVRDVVIIKAHAPPAKPGSTILRKPGQFSFLPFVRFEEILSLSFIK